MSLVWNRNGNFFVTNNTKKRLLNGARLINMNMPSKRIVELNPEQFKQMMEKAIKLMGEELDEAEKILKKLMQEIDSREKITVLNNLASIAYERGKIEQALETSWSHTCKLKLLLKVLTLLVLLPRWIV